MSSEPLLDEFERIPIERFSFGGGPARMVRAELEEALDLVQPLHMGRFEVRDPDDRVVLATASAGAAELIVTGDEDLLSLVLVGDVQIVRPRALLERLESS